MFRGQMKMLYGQREKENRADHPHSEDTKLSPRRLRFRLTVSGRLASLGASQRSLLFGTLAGELTASSTSQKTSVFSVSPSPTRIPEINNLDKKSRQNRPIKEVTGKIVISKDLAGIFGWLRGAGASS